MKDAIDIAVLDFGGQYVENFRRIFGETGAICEVLPNDTPEKELRERNVKAVILSGGPYSVYEKSAPKLSYDVHKTIMEGDLPTLGVCYGHQLLAFNFNGKVKRGHIGEYGFAKLEVLGRSKLFDGIPSDDFTCWMSHGDEINQLPTKFIPTARTENCSYAAVRHESLPIFGVQFHPEVTHTEFGDRILSNFQAIARIEPKEWDIQGFISDAIEQIRADVGNGRIIAAVSGGVDSTVATLLAKEAIGEEKIRCIHVDTGLMRKGESNDVVAQLKRVGLDVEVIRASSAFVSALNGVNEPDERRMKIGEMFIRLFEERARKFNASHLLQATIAPDVIESTRGIASAKNSASHGGYIKLHHNVGGLPATMGLQLLEPVRSLFKYQVRAIARRLQIPEFLAERQPQPGPSAAVRITDELSPENITLWQEINDYLEKRIESLPLEQRPAQYFTILTTNKLWKGLQWTDSVREILKDQLSGDYRFLVMVPSAKTVGVKGDERVFGYTILLTISDKLGRNVFDKLDHIQLLNLQSKITGEIREIVRVCILTSAELYPQREHSVIIRAVDTRDFMTATPSKISKETVSEISNAILKRYPKIGSTYMDYTTKPSATIEYL